jgi:molybdenum cofactor sulfurtransferase
MRTASASAFHTAHPAFDTLAVERLRSQDYARLDELGQVYLDYTGAGLHAASQVREHAFQLQSSIFGNPHSANPTSQAATTAAERTRAAILNFFGAPPDDYTVVFTSNASGALKLVGESFPFQPGSRYLLSADNHNSVNGIREFVRARGASFTYVPLEPCSLRLDEDALLDELRLAPPGGQHLFAYPAQSNLSGVQHSLAWLELARDYGWTTLLDAASFVPTNRLSIGDWQPDFVAVSFYKLFGYPTGVGCLIARRSALERLERPWFAGGTISISSVAGDGHTLAEGETAFEDGTINFLSLPAVEIGLRHLSTLGMDTLATRVRCLTAWLLDEMTALRHPNGEPLVRVYGPTTTDRRGGTVAFNLLAADGHLLDYRQVEAEANRWRISLRSGCFCNPGASEAALGLSPADLRTLFDGGPVSEVAVDYRLNAGAVRASLGIVSTPSDIARFLELLRSFL